MPALLPTLAAAATLTTLLTPLQADGQEQITSARDNASAISTGDNSTITMTIYQGSMDDAPLREEYNRLSELYDRLAAEQERLSNELITLRSEYIRENTDAHSKVEQIERNLEVVTIQLENTAANLDVIEQSQRHDSGLACDIDQLSNGCIRCLVEIDSSEHTRFCYADNLPEPLLEEFGEDCPQLLTHYEEAAERIVGAIRTIKVMNSNFIMSITPFESSGGDCSLLPEALQISNAYNNLKYIWEIEDLIINQFEACIAGNLSKIFNFVEERGGGTSLFHDRIRRLQDIEIELYEIRIELSTESARAERLMSEAEFYTHICDF